MFKFIGTLAFLVAIYCVVMLISSIFNRRINTKLWKWAAIISAIVLIISYYVDISSDGYKEKYDAVIEQYDN